MAMHQFSKIRCLPPISKLLRARQQCMWMISSRKFRFAAVARVDLSECNKKIVRSQANLLCTQESCRKFDCVDVDVCDFSTILQTQEILTW